MNEEKLNYFEVDDTKYETVLTNKFLTRKKYTPANPGKILAFIPGSIRNIFVTENQPVKKGDPLLILEAMKMKNELNSPIDGVVKKIHTKIDEKVAKLQLLIELE
jgi:biotin carboxyl carrier protein